MKKKQEYDILGVAWQLQHIGETEPRREMAARGRPSLKKNWSGYTRRGMATPAYRRDRATPRDGRQRAKCQGEIESEVGR